MRPLRIEVEGFSAYRAPVEVDFTDVDFFSLTGATGAGKSSLIDAMIFALFGRVPRLGGNAVAPAITAGADRARVRFDFAVDGEEYTAVRLAQRTSTGGATVKEARLQRRDKVLAHGADDVTVAVEELLRLRFDDFTRTVVLPQGDFARFLTATRSERQGLLRSLLGFDIYPRMRELARTRAAVAAERMESATRSIESLDLPDDETALAAITRRDALVELAEDVLDKEKALSELEKAVVEARSHEDHITGSVERLESIEPPDHLEQLGLMITEARDELETATEALAATEANIAATEAERAELPGTEQLVAWERARGQLAEAERRLATSDLDEAMEKLSTAEAELVTAQTELDQVRSQLARVRDTHSAHALATTLARGEPCPVCTQVVTEVPAIQVLPELGDLDSDESKRSTHVEMTRQLVEVARTEVARIESARHEIADRRKSLMADLEGAPEAEAAASMNAGQARLQAELSDLVAERSAAEATARKARARLEDLAEDARQVGRKLIEADRKVADLGPPLSESDDVVVQWKELVSWRLDRLEELRPEMEAASVSVATAGEAAAKARRSIITILGEHDIAQVDPYAVQVAAALQDARHKVAAHEKAAADAVVLAEQAKTAGAEAAVASTLANHLRADGFEQWLMAGALGELVDGANDLLSHLSAGGYSLHSDASGGFSIVDHRNADEVRSVTTLSGGETFLVSLALALSLAETLAAKGGSGLDAIILDEGFGTLDDESLETVASVLEELTGRGLMVGIITHVKELAARAPVRYEVTSEPAGARVRRV